MHYGRRNCLHVKLTVGLSWSYGKLQRTIYLLRANALLFNYEDIVLFTDQLIKITCNYETPRLMQVFTFSLRQTHSSVNNMTLNDLPLTVEHYTTVVAIKNLVAKLRKVGAN
jgi:hypothetical protein